jgi:hypothetical protein
MQDVQRRPKSNLNHDVFVAAHQALGISSITALFTSKIGERFHLI